MPESSSTPPSFPVAGEARELTAAGQRHAIDTALLMTIAAALIVNSHLEDFYPRAFLAADGLLGNSIFFFLSGFGIAMSESRNRRTFFQYYRRRLIRIYPAVIACVLVFDAINHNLAMEKNTVGYLQRYLWPTSYNFVADIIPFYAIFFFVLRAPRQWGFTLAAVITLAVYLSCYIPDALKIAPHEHLSMGSHGGYQHDSAYFSVMLLGGWMALNPQHHAKARGNPLIAGLVTGLVVIAYFALKFVMVVKGRFAAEYGILQLLMLPGCVGLFICATSVPVSRLVHRFKPVAALVGLVSSLTLEIYLVHIPLLHYEWLIRIGFPLNIAALWMVTLAIAFTLAWAVKPLQKLAARSES